MQISEQWVGVGLAIGGAMVGWIISVERRLALGAELQRAVRRVDRRLEFLIGTMAGRKVLDDLAKSDEDEQARAE